MSRVKSEICGVKIDGKLYVIDKALFPALQHVPRELLPPLLDALARDFKTGHDAWIRGAKRTAAWRVTWVDRAIPLVRRRMSYASIGRILEGKGFGSADRIARTLAQIVRKKKSVRRRQRT